MPRRVTGPARTFYTCHREYFENSIDNPGAQTVEQKWALGAQAVWAALDRDHRKPYYKNASRDLRSQILYEPPQASNSFRGANRSAWVPRTDFPQDPGDPNNLRALPALNFPDNHVLAVRDSQGVRIRDREDDIYSFEDVIEEFQVTPLASGHADGGSWHRDAKLGDGGYGQVWRWSYRDANGNELENLVIKDSMMWTLWDKVTCWSTDDRTIAREVAAHRTLVTQRAQASTPEIDAGRRYILGYRGSRLESRYKYCRIAAPRASLGDLKRLAISFYPSPESRVFRQTPAQYRVPSRLPFPDDYEGVDDVEDDNYEWMPVHLIWRVYGSIIKALIYMHDRGLMHRDLKPENVLMMRETAASDPMMGDWGVRPLLADFGAAMPVAPVRYRNPCDFDETQTACYAAPEQFVGIPPLVEDNTGQGHFGYLMDEKTDVFGTAMTVFALMTMMQHNSDSGAIWRHDDPHALDWPAYEDPNITDEHSRLLSRFGTPGTSDEEEDDQAIYGHWRQHSLADGTLSQLLIDSCKFQPQDRPTLQQVLDRIEQWLRDNPEPAHAAQVASGRSKYDYWFSHLHTA